MKKVLACDYDGTLIDEPPLERAVYSALIEAKSAGYVLAIVTGCTLDRLLSEVEQVDVFDLVVAETGTVIYLPAAKYFHTVSSVLSLTLTQELSILGVPFVNEGFGVRIGRESEVIVKSIIQKLGLSLQLIPHRETAMVLPKGVNKGAGLQLGLEIIGFSGSSITAIGDAENDLALFEVASFRVAVNNAIEEVKLAADVVTTKPYGDGVTEFIRTHLLVVE